MPAPPRPPQAEAPVLPSIELPQLGASVRLEKMVGQGGFGQVYSGLLVVNKPISPAPKSGKQGGRGEAKELRPARVAVKIVDITEVPGRSSKVQASLGEAKIVVDLMRIEDDPDCLQDDDLLCFRYVGVDLARRQIIYVSELMTGDMIEMLTSERVSNSRKLEWGGAFLSSSLRGLQLLHDHGIVHRDIKIDNILYRRSEEIGNDTNNNSDLPTVKLADFGLACYVYSASVPVLPERAPPCESSYAGSWPFVQPAVLAYNRLIKALLDPRNSAALEAFLQAQTEKHVPGFASISEGVKTMREIDYRWSFADDMYSLGVSFSWYLFGLHLEQFRTRLARFYSSEYARYLLELPSKLFPPELAVLKETFSGSVSDLLFLEEEEEEKEEKKKEPTGNKKEEEASQKQQKQQRRQERQLEAITRLTYNSLVRDDYNLLSKLQQEYLPDWAMDLRTVQTTLSLTDFVTLMQRNYVEIMFPFYQSLLANYSALLKPVRAQLVDLGQQFQNAQLYYQELVTRRINSADEQQRVSETLGQLDQQMRQLEDQQRLYSEQLQIIQVVAVLSVPFLAVGEKRPTAADVLAGRMSMNIAVPSTEEVVERFSDPETLLLLGHSPPDLSRLPGGGAAFPLLQQLDSSIRRATKKSTTTSSFSPASSSSAFSPFSPLVLSFAAADVTATEDQDQDQFGNE
jgi:serine/threonine protein kinase